MNMFVHRYEYMLPMINYFLENEQPSRAELRSGAVLLNPLLEPTQGTKWLLASTRMLYKKRMHNRAHYQRTCVCVCVCVRVCVCVPVILNLRRVQLLSGHGSQVESPPARRVISILPMFWFTRGKKTKMAPDMSGIESSFIFLKIRTVFSSCVSRI